MEHIGKHIILQIFWMVDVLLLHFTYGNRWNPLESLLLSLLS